MYVGNPPPTYPLNRFSGPTLGQAGSHAYVGESGRGPLNGLVSKLKMIVHFLSKCVERKFYDLQLQAQGPRLMSEVFSTTNQSRRQNWKCLCQNNLTL